MCRSSIALEEISSNISGNRAGVAVAEKHRRAIPFEKSQGVRLVVRKRRISDAFAFVPVAGQATKVDYLYADGAARGRALWASLWRAVKVQFVEASREQSGAKARPGV
jgi:hypothetical protein